MRFRSRKLISFLTGTTHTQGRRRGTPPALHTRASHPRQKHGSGSPSAAARTPRARRRDRPERGVPIRGQNLGDKRVSNSAARASTFSSTVVRPGETPWPSMKTTASPKASCRRLFVRVEPWSAATKIAKSSFFPSAAKGRWRGDAGSSRGNRFAEKRLTVLNQDSSPFLCPTRSSGPQR